MLFDQEKNYLRDYTPVEEPPQPRKKVSVVKPKP